MTDDMILELPIWPELLARLKRHKEFGRGPEQVALYFIVRGIDDLDQKILEFTGRESR